MELAIETSCYCKSAAWPMLATNPRVSQLQSSRQQVSCQHIPGRISFLLPGVVASHIFRARENRKAHMPGCSAVTLNPLASFRLLVSRFLDIMISFEMTTQ